MKCTAISDRQAGSRMGKSKIGSCIQKNSKSDYKIDVNFTSGITTSFQAVLTISEIPKTVFMNCYPAANSGGGDNTDSVSSVCPKENSSINCMPGSQTPPDCRSPRREWIEKHCKNVSFLD
ncbi:MAG: hypothetical protein NTV34_03305, partial [Proteobacteria bacterium]|nr:hypothetical protein [Pseudomonadota bacterium]